MCTAISITTKNHYFGRNLDYEHTFGEKVVITPRNYKFIFSNSEETHNHYAIIGMALPYNDYPLYFDATNEKGLSVAGLNFPENAFYFKEAAGKLNVASYELIPRILCFCETAEQAKELISKINITDREFAASMPPSPLHWIVADKHQTLTVEQTSDGLKIYNNPTGVLTNNPPFHMQLQNLANYMHVTAHEPENLFSHKIKLMPYSRGMGAMGLPGDFSSASRFVKCCFVKLNCVFGEAEKENVEQFFHILDSVAQIKGCVEVGESYEITNYSSCCNTDKGIYYYKTYMNSQICAINMHNENLDSEKLVVYELFYDNNFYIQNKKNSSQEQH